MQIIAIIVSVVLFIFNILLGIIAYLLKSKIEAMETDVKNTKSEMKEIKDNYLDRFEKLNKNINDSKIEIVKELSKIYLKISESGNHHNSQ